MSRTVPTLPPRRGGGRAALPAHVPPMLATLSDGLPSDGDKYQFEYKWDGVRALAYVAGGKLRLESRNLLDITATYPELQALLPALKKRPVLLDGEIVALNGAGHPDFPLLQNRMHVRAPTLALIARVPVAYMVFDVLHLDGRSLFNVPCGGRRELLEKLPIAEPGLVPPAVVGTEAGEALLEAARDVALEGIVAKRLDSIYEPGRRSWAWRKIKIVQTTELVVGGWTAERSARGGSRVGALLLGFYESTKSEGLVYAGAVGTGFTDAEHARVVPLLQRLASEKSPFSAKLPRPRMPRGPIQFLRPSLVVQVEYRRWPEGGLMQQAAYKGLRNDKSACEIVGATVKG